MKQILVFDTNAQRTLCFDFLKNSETLKQLKEQIHERLGYNPENYNLLQNGKILQETLKLEKLNKMQTIDINFGLKGGKGGFGSLLRGQAATKKKITNFDACRDLQGRRIRHVQSEKLLVDFFKKKKEEDNRISVELKEYKELKRETGFGNDNNLKDFKLSDEYRDKLEKWDKNMDSSIQKGLNSLKKKKKSNKLQPPVPNFNDNQLIIAQDNYQLQQLDEEEEDQEENKKIKKLEKTQIPSLFSEENNINQSNGVTNNIADQIHSGNIMENTEQQDIVINKDQEISVTNQNQEENIQQQQQQQQQQEEEDAVQVIDLQEIQSIEQLEILGGDQLRNQLKRLGLKCGGTVRDRAQRLWDIKVDPKNLFNPKYLAKK